MDRRQVTVSKFLAKHLRHAPEALGLTLRPGGWVRVDDLLAASAGVGFAITYDELIECVETNDKKRYSFDDSGDLIRAIQKNRPLSCTTAQWSDFWRRSWLKA